MATKSTDAGGWFRNLEGEAVTILHQLGTYVVEAGRIAKLPFTPQHHALAAATEKDFKAQAEADAKAAAEKAAKDAESAVQADVTAPTVPAPAAAETPKE